MNYEKDQLKKQLDIIYNAYNKKEYIHPDPLEFLDNYPDIKDREIAALIASSLAYGRVDQILKHVRLVFAIMHSSVNKDFSCQSNKYSLNSYIINSSEPDIFIDFKRFKYRFTNGEHIASFLVGIKSMVKEYGSLKSFFLNGMTPKDETIIPALTHFVKRIKQSGNCGNLAPDPDKGSACKRNALFLRWMVRKDEVDPGGWDQVSPAMLIVPLDTHMHHVGSLLGFTKRKQADMRTALEITDGFRQISPDDPVKYDFCLTRFGIHPEMDFRDLETIINIES
ncbi:MAG: TIGR02757 family protein [Desulfamplus sp.]|nr:TIGR02757 family protein [Desulfamplus sp.]